MAETLHNADYSGELSPEESLPILEMLSKLHPVAAVQSPPLYPFREFPHVCWMNAEKGDNGAFARVGGVLREVPTKSRWFLTYEVPYFCMLAQAGKPGEGWWLYGRQSFSTSEIRSFRELAIQEIPQMISFVEERASLRGLPSRGVDLRARSLTLPGMTDYVEPRVKNVYLVADPEAFSHGGNITSDYDRALHYGLTDQEISFLQSAAESDKSADYKVLHNFFYEPYKDQKVLPTEIGKLEEECQILKGRASDPDAIRGLEKILSIAASARRYGLGIFMDSD